MLLVLIMFLPLMSFSTPNTSTNNNLFLSERNIVQQKAPTKNQKPEKPKYKVTFVELGSVNCIPCKKMQEVMKSIEKKYSSQVKVVFHDVWTDAGKPFGKQYGITAIPTQVFLDAAGKEFFRHEGFFPEEELVKILNQKGVQ